VVSEQLVGAVVAPVAEQETEVGMQLLIPVQCKINGEKAHSLREVKALNYVVGGGGTATGTQAIKPQPYKHVNDEAARGGCFHRKAQREPAPSPPSKTTLPAAAA
jgi:hypothetical protein